MRRPAAKSTLVLINTTAPSGYSFLVEAVRFQDHFTMCRLERSLGLSVRTSSDLRHLLISKAYLRASTNIALNGHGQA